MKTKLLFLSFSFVSLFSQAQCFEIESYSWNDDATFTITLNLLEAGIIIAPDGSVLFPTGTGLGQVQYDYIQGPGPGNSMLFLNLTIPCYFIVNVDYDYFSGTANVVNTAPSSCGGSDGSVCIDLQGFPADFSILGIQSVGGCITGLSPGTYTVSFDPFTDPNGIIHYNPDIQIEILELAIDLVNIAGDLYPDITGGSGDYSWGITPGTFGDYEPVSAFTNGCYTLSVIDNVTGCTATLTEYVPVNCIGDIAPNGGDGVVNTADLMVLLQAFGSTPGWGVLEPADFDCQGVVSSMDLLIFLQNFGGPC